MKRSLKRKKKENRWFWGGAIIVESVINNRPFFLSCRVKINRDLPDLDHTDQRV